MTTRTKTELLTPPAALLQTCDAPALRRTQRVRDMADNLVTLQTALERCAARTACLVWWWQTAAGVPVTARCEKSER